MTDDWPSALALSWSGGKDSALALWLLGREHGIVPRGVAHDRDGRLRAGVDARRPPLPTRASGERDRRAPLWHRDTTGLAREFIAAGFEAVIVCVDPAKLDRSFAGRRFDDQLLADLPAGVDPCGENGEFHTFVYAGPILSASIAVQVGETVERDGFVFTDLTAADARIS